MLEFERVVDLHRASRATPSDPTPECLDAAKQHAESESTSIIEAEYVFDPLLIQVSLYARAIFEAQCFGDGNTRTAWLALVDVLSRNSLRVEADPATAVAAFKAFTQGKGGLDHFTYWLSTTIVAA